MYILNTVTKKHCEATRTEKKTIYLLCSVQLFLSLHQLFLLIGETNKLVQGFLIDMTIALQLLVAAF